MKFYLTGVSAVCVLELGEMHVGEWVSVGRGQVRVGAKSGCEWVEPAEMEIVRKLDGNGCELASGVRSPPCPVAAIRL